MLLISGGGLCCISSFPYVWNETLPKGNAQFSIVVLGSAISSAGFVSTVGGASKVRLIGRDKNVLKIRVKSKI